MKTTHKRKVKEKVRVQALGIVGQESGALYLTSNQTMYEVYFDGFVAEERMYSLRGRGVRVEIVPIEITYSVPIKSKK